MNKYLNELNIAKQAALAAGDYLKQHRNERLGQISKGDNKNFALLQDLESDKVIKNIIAKEFSEDFILSEETKNEVSLGNQRMWIIDPIDGTRNYGNGFHYFSVSIALWEKGLPKVAVVYGPAINEMYTAVEEGGAYLNDEPLAKLDTEKSLSDSLVATGFAYFKGDDLPPQLERYQQVLNRSVDVLRLGSAALDICQVAANRLGSYYETGLKPWDLAAGILIANEVGGVVTNYKGDNVEVFIKGEVNTGIDILVAKNKVIQKELIDILR